MKEREETNIYMFRYYDVHSQDKLIIGYIFIIIHIILYWVIRDPICRITTTHISILKQYEFHSLITKRQ